MASSPFFFCPTPHCIYLGTDFRAHLPNLVTLFVQVEPQFPHWAFPLHGCPFILCGGLPLQPGNATVDPGQRSTAASSRLYIGLQSVFEGPSFSCLLGLLNINRYSFTDFLLSTTVSIFFSLVTDISYNGKPFQCSFRNSSVNTSFDLLDWATPYFLATLQQLPHRGEQALLYDSP